MKATFTGIAAAVVIAVGAVAPVAGATTVLFDKLVRPEYVSNFRTICTNMGGHFQALTYYPNPTYWVEVKCTR